MTSIIKDPTVPNVIRTMTKNERIALYNMVTELFNDRFSSTKLMAAALVIGKMSENKKRVAYYLLGQVRHVLEATKTAEAIKSELKELLKLCS